MKNCIRLLILVSLFFSAVANAADPVDVRPPQQKILASSTGRFVFGQISEFRRDQYMLDTQTGRLWQTACSKSEKGASTSPDSCTVVLQPVPYVGPGDDKCSVLPR